MDAEVRTPSQDAALLTEAVLSAGEMALELFKSEQKSWTKSDGSPVSEADLAVDEALATHLKKARPNYGLMSEEHTEAIDIEARTFVIDPIDGTRAYLRGDPVWSVVAAIIEKGRPIAAAIYEPFSNLVYAAATGSGATRNGVPIRVSEHETVQDSTLAIPGLLFRRGGFVEAGANRSTVIPSLALRLARVADAKIDGVITKQGAHHWDLAAGDLIVQEAGGTLLSLAGTVPRYDSLETAHGSIVAAPQPLIDGLRQKAVEAFATIAE